MEYIKDVILVIFGALLSLLGANAIFEKQKAEAQAKAFQELSERLVKLETEMVTDKEVRAVFKEYFEPFLVSLHKMQTDLTDIKIQIAKGNHK